MPTARSTSPPLQPWTPRPNPNPNERTRLLRSPQPSPLIKPVRPRSIRSIASHATHDSHSHSRQGSPDPSSASDISDRRVAADDRTSLVVPKPKRTLRSRLLFATIVVLLAVCVYASFVDDFMGDVEATISCGTCIALLAPLQALARIGDDAFVDLFVGFCTKLGIEDADVCAGAVGTQAPILAHDLRSITLASPAAKNFCTTIFGLCPLPNTIPHTVNVTERPAEALEDPHFRVAAATRHHRRAAARKKWTSRGREPFQIVHISDVHVDRQYTVGPLSFPVQEKIEASEISLPDFLFSPRCAAWRRDRLHQSHLLPRLRTTYSRPTGQVPSRTGASQLRLVKSSPVGSI